MDAHTHYFWAIVALTVVLLYLCIPKGDALEEKVKKISSYEYLDTLDYKVWKSALVIQEELQKKHGLLLDPVDVYDNLENLIGEGLVQDRMSLPLLHIQDGELHMQEQREFRRSRDNDDLRSDLEPTPDEDLVLH